MRTFLSLGSNLGERLENLRSATTALDNGPHLSVVASSAVYETDPVEVDSGHPDYLNCVVEVECGLPAIELLRLCQRIEAALGRDRKGEMAPRTVDIDVLLYGDDVIDEPDLGVPHRGITRAFNLRCLAEIDEDLVVPGLGTVGEMVRGVDLSGVRRTGYGVVTES